MGGVAPHLRRFGLSLAALAVAAASASFVVFVVGPVAVPQATQAAPGQAFAQARVRAPATSARRLAGSIGPGTAQQVCAEPIPRGTSAGSAREVGAMFVRTAVVRRNTICSYDLVTPTLRQGLSRREWQTGNIPVQPFPTEYPEDLRAEVVPSVTLASERGTWVTLEAADLGRAVFELVVVKRDGRWLVDYWAPAPGAAAAAHAAGP